ncbi:MAG: tripartite tricarboxylate transporter substrate binding protein [Pseudomonadota bacterium]|nr:tripartite tricarboxylate transporter substrate binding protein [Pseudomonadota bacterium]
MRRLAALGAAVMMATGLGVAAQTFPSKPVHIVVPFPPGGGADALARIMQPHLVKLWGQPVIIENKPGASGHIGAEYVAGSPPDGYVLMMSSTASLTEKNVSQFAPVSLVSASPYVVVANPKVPAANIRGLVDYARKNPGKLTFGSSGTGAASHLSAELFKSLAAIDMLHVPYKGTGPAVTDLIAGQIDLLFGPAQAVMSYVQAGRLKAYAVTSAKRSPTLPDLPTVAEAGVPGYEAIGWFGLLAPAATPKAVVNRLSADANAALREPDVVQKMLVLGAEPAGNTPERFAAFIRDDQGKWSKLMRERGIKPE